MEYTILFIIGFVVICTHFFLSLSCLLLAEFIIYILNCMLYTQILMNLAFIPLLHIPMYL